MRKVDAKNDCLLIDSRKVRANALLTTVVLTTALFVPIAFKIALLSIQGITFALGVIAPKYHPYGWISRQTRLFKLFPDGHGEHPKPIRFSQEVGLVFVIPALVFLISGHPLVGDILIGFCAIASALNAFANICLACLIYPRLTLIVYKVKHFGSN